MKQLDNDMDLNFLTSHGGSIAPMVQKSDETTWNIFINSFWSPTEQDWIFPYTNMGAS